MFSFIFIVKNNNTNRILFLNFVNVSNFYWKFYIFKIKLIGKFFINYCISCWVPICRIEISDYTPFKAFIIINILNIN